GLTPCCQSQRSTRRRSSAKDQVSGGHCTALPVDRLIVQPRGGSTKVINHYGDEVLKVFPRQLSGGSIKPPAPWVPRRPRPMEAPRSAEDCDSYPRPVHRRFPNALDRLGSGCSPLHRRRPP